jgi:hypothetical protein
MAVAREGVLVWYGTDPPSGRYSKSGRPKDDRDAGWIDLSPGRSSSVLV